PVAGLPPAALPVSVPSTPAFLCGDFFCQGRAARRASPRLTIPVRAAAETACEPADGYVFASVARPGSMVSRQARPPLPTVRAACRQPMEPPDTQWRPAPATAASGPALEP